MINYPLHKPNEVQSLLKTMHSNFKKNWETCTSTRVGKFNDEDLVENSENLLSTQNNLANAPRIKSFKIKIPFFRKRPFGKHDSFNGTELNFVELDCKSRCHNLYEKQSKFFKLACGRAISVGRGQDKHKSSRRPSGLRLL